VASQSALDGAQHAAPHGPEQRRVAVQEEPKSFRKRHHPLAHRHLREHVLDEVGGRLGHAPGGAGRAQAAALAGVGDQEVVAASVAVCSREAAGQDPALEVAAQLALDVTRGRRAVGIALAPACQPGLEVQLHQPVERRALGTATAVDARCGGAGRGTEVRGDGRHPCLAR
jgi:hypothetical protein